MLPDLAAGHVHAYERTFQTLDYTLDGCAPRWLTMGAQLPSLVATILPFVQCLPGAAPSRAPHTGMSHGVSQERCPAAAYKPCHHAIACLALGQACSR